DRAVEQGDLLKPRQQLEVVARGLAEADAGIERHALGPDAVAPGPLEARAEPLRDLAGGIAVARVVLHGSRRPAHVHEHDAGARPPPPRREPSPDRRAP